MYTNNILISIYLDLIYQHIVRVSCPKFFLAKNSAYFVLNIDAM